MIEIFKIMKAFDRVDIEKMFPLVGETRTRGHKSKIVTNKSNREFRRNFFTQRVVRMWNSLP